MKTLLYYGAEINKQQTDYSGFPHYTMGVHAYTLKETEKEEDVRKQIENRCMENARFAPGLEAIHPMLKGMPHSKFHWIN